MYVNNDLTTLKTDIKVNVNKDKASMLGVSTSEIDRTIRMAIAGLNIGTFRNDNDDDDDVQADSEDDGDDNGDKSSDSAGDDSE